MFFTKAWKLKANIWRLNRFDGGKKSNSKLSFRILRGQEVFVLISVTGYHGVGCFDVAPVFCGLKLLVQRLEERLLKKTCFSLGTRSLTQLTQFCQNILSCILGNLILSFSLLLNYCFIM